MKKIYVLDYAESHDEAGATTVMYDAAEADALVEQLELALKSCMFALTKQRESVNEWNITVDHAIAEAETALALMVSATK